MVEVLVWILFSVPIEVHNAGKVTEIARFSTLEACEHVRVNLPGEQRHKSVERCVQARILITK